MRYIIQFSPKRTNVLETLTQAEGVAIGNHFEYLQEMLAAGKLDFAGRRTDAAFGIAVFHADSDMQATSIMENDPAVIAGVFSATCGQFEFALASVPNFLTDLQK